MAAEPRVFVASSREAQRLAEAVQQNLRGAEVTVWNQDALQIGHVTVDELCRNLARSDFGVFVLDPDDIINIRGEEQLAARDNVILELGIFIGRLGKERSFIIRPQNLTMRLPTDLLGVITGEYDRDRSKREPAAALGAACTQIGDAIRRQHGIMTTGLNTTITDALETICRTMTAPITPEQASLRAFIFRKEGNELVCRHFWDPYESEEYIGTTRFRIDEETAAKVVVVRCFLDKAMRRPQEDATDQSPVEPLPKNFEGVKGNIKSSLTYVLAAPIRGEDDSIWGVVDFDASNDMGKKLLQERASSAVMLRLAKHLSPILAR